MASPIIEVLGWLGGVCLLAAYALVSTRRLQAQSPLYHVANATGSILLLVNAYIHEAHPVVLVNLVWFTIAAYSLVWHHRT